jgi:ferredoxin-NADP reductase/predicted pyridoxine 5'-phosphate oxidase superfamily flavin-nucleotide-binding protein
MSHKYVQIAFSKGVRQVQIEQGSRAAYAGMDQGEDYNYLLSENEAQFIEQRDSFYMASVNEDAWPYVQHRGGPKGFLKVLDAQTLGFVDFKGNRQYVSTGNFRSNNRVALILMDYPNRRRLKIMGRIEAIPDSDWEMQAKLELTGYRATVERAFMIKIEGFDWNCPQHLTPRFTEAEMEDLYAPIVAQNRALKLMNNTLPEPYPKELGKGSLPLRITGMRQLTPRIRAFELRHRDGLALPRISAGAHLQIPVRLANGTNSLRHYSICSNPAREDRYEIAVLHEEEGQAGRGGSHALHQHVQLGHVWHCEPPSHVFHLHSDDRPAVLIAGGIGITPIKAMAQVLKNRGTPLHLHYAGRIVSEMAFVDRLQWEFKEAFHLYASDQKQRINLAEILRNAAPDSVFYVCGPQRLIDDLLKQAQALQIDPERIRFERFSAPNIEDARPVTLHLAQSKQVIQVRQDQSLLDAILEAGVEAAYSCKTGACKSCAVKVVDGQAQHHDHCLSDVERTQQKLFCPCVSRSHSQALVLDI